MKYLYKQIILTIFIIVIVSGAIFNLTNGKKDKPEIKLEEKIVEENTNSIFMCYYRGEKTDRGFYDVTWLKMRTEGDKVTGELHNLPAEKDSKVGTFEGTVGPLDQKAMARVADVFWDSFAEGMNVKEELLISFGDDSASMSFGGDAKDRGDGVYIYTDKSKITFQLQMSQIDCETLDEKLAVEKYVRENISTLAVTVNKPVLGGSWYVLSVFANPSGKNGKTTYEDGHIQSTATFTYVYEKRTGIPVIRSFKVN